MRKISIKILQEWYREEYTHNADHSVYGNAPEKLNYFYSLLQKSGLVKTVLDLGCGDGRSLIELAKLGFQVTGIDLYGKNIAETRAEKVGVSIRFIEANIATYPFEEEEYDAIIASEVFHLISRENVENITDRIIQSVLPNGYIYISILSDLKRRFIASGEEFEYENQPNFTKEQSKKLLSEKFSKWKILKLGTFHDEQDWPVQSGNYPIEPYHWSGDYVFLIAQEKTT